LGTRVASLDENEARELSLFAMEETS
jgi:hypothetical protein